MHLSQISLQITLIDFYTKLQFSVMYIASIFYFYLFDLLLEYW